MVNNSKNAVRILQFARKRAPQAVAKLLFPWNWGKKQTNKREKKKKKQNYSVRIILTILLTRRIILVFRKRYQFITWPGCKGKRGAT